MSNHSEKRGDQEASGDESGQMPEDASTELVFPDGGFKAWLTVAGGFLVQISSIGFLSAFSVFESYYIETMPSQSASNISWVGSLQIFGCFFLGLWSGRLSDKFGPKLPLAFGTFFMVFGTMMASISKSFYQILLSQGLCSSIGFGLLFLMVIGTLLVSPRFPRIPEEPIPFKQFLTDKRSSLFTMSTLIIFFAIYVPEFFISSYALQGGASFNVAFYLSSILNAGAFFGCYFFGLGADRGLGSFNTLTVVAFSCAVTAFGWIGAHNGAGLVVWTVIYGFLSGAVQALFSPCMSLLAPEPGLIGTWNGMSFLSTLELSHINEIRLGICITVVSFAVLGTGPIAGRLYDNAQGTYLSMQLFTGVFLTVGSVLYLVTRLTVSRAAVV
ncbi:Riboflavin transporter MCH5 [Penicillium rolfsii]|nr:Riboflavin transporter MCH5 [Penicillium rolfsii]